MDWRHQLEALLCAAFLLASMIAIAIRPLVVSVANVEVKVGLSTEGVPRPGADLNVTSKAKAFPIRTPRAP
jgi:hypothetical protein